MDEELARKMMINKFSKIIIQNIPDDINVFNELTFDEVVKEKYDLVIQFIFGLEEMKEVINRVVKNDLLEENGYLYFIYPKKNNKKYDEYIHRDSIFPYLNVDEETGYVAKTTLAFNKMFSFDEVFTLTALKNIKDKKVNKTSSKVTDYIDKIPMLRSELKEYKSVLEQYDNLTPGYQRDWARYVYSAKTISTQQKRIKEMIDILKLGFKSKQLYLQSKK